VALAAALLLALFWPRGGWEVETLSGADSCVVGPCKWAVGQALEAPEGTSWRIAVADLGALTILPGAAIRREADALHLERGRIDVEVMAPPRVFRVRTPAAWVVDLGCAFRLAATERTTRLAVQDGSVALENDLGTSIVTAGSSAEVEVGKRPSLPVREEARSELRRAVRALEGGGPGALASVLAEAEAGDLFTLWHVLQVVPEAERSAVLDAVALLSTEIDRPPLLRLEAEALRDLWRAVIPYALKDPVPR
jgi:hypothetical protein